ncbi:GNAT family N-acetyltransferase [Streptomyces sp. PT12]|uniref:GNAT family N-acetyltransferase n=1 Tax=Streptomyces sp. PT12 TaxID=1510197 RepID=UPI0011BF7D75|nr:GNAT family N-acetyltransferase [Streptomyces sp. PT12]
MAADSDTPGPSIRFPHGRLRTTGGYAPGRACPPLAARGVVAVPGPRAVVTAEGRKILLRAAGPGDLPEALALHARCSERTLAGRYRASAHEADALLPHLLHPAMGRSVAAVTDDGDVVGLGHLLFDGEESEVALLVADDWQRLGIGSALLRRLIGLAVHARHEAVYLVTGPANAAVIALMNAVINATGLPLERQTTDGSLVLSARLAPGGCQPQLPVVLPAQGGW